MLKKIFYLFVVLGLVVGMYSYIKSAVLNSKSVFIASEHKTIKNLDKNSEFRHNYQLGNERIYKIEQIAHITYDSVNSAMKTTTVEISGELLENVDKISNDYIIKSVTILKPNLLMKYNDTIVNSQLLDKMQADLSKEYYIKVSKQGQMETIFLPPNSSVESAKIIKGIYASLQLYLPDKAVENGEWNSSEQDTIGKYFAKYHISKGSDKDIEIRKNKLNYTDVLDSNSELVPAAKALQQVRIDPLTNSVIKFELTRGMITSVAEKEKMYLQTPESDTKVEVESRITFIESRLTARQLGDFDEDKILSERQNLEVATKEHRINMQRQSFEKKLAGATSSSLFAKLSSSIESDTKGTNIELFEQLRAYFMLFPAKINELAQEIKKLDSNSKYFEPKLSFYFGIYTSLDFSEAEKSLLELTEEFKSDLRIARQALPALANYSNPSSASKEYLLNLNQNAFDSEIAMMSSLALGAVAKKMTVQNSGDPDAQITDYLLNKYLATNDKLEKSDLLGALGNSGSGKLIPIIRQIFSENADDAKLNAAYALRFLPQGEADSLLKSTIESSKTSDNLKIEVLKTLQYRTNIDESIAVAAAAYSKSLSDNVKSQAITTIAALGFKAKDKAKNILSDIISKEKSNNVLILARRMENSL